MQQILDEITKNWVALQPVLPIVFTLMLSCLVVGFAAGRFFLDQTVRNLDSALKLADRQVADYKAKLDGASPDEVREKLDRLETTVRRLAPVELDDEHVIAARKALRVHTHSIVVFATGATGTSFPKLTSQLRRIFEDEKWAVQSAILIDQSAPSPTGIALYLNGHAERVAQSLAVKEMLDASGVEYSLYKFPDNEPDRYPQIAFTHRA